MNIPFGDSHQFDTTISDVTTVLWTVPLLDIWPPGHVTLTPEMDCYSLLTVLRTLAGTRCTGAVVQVTDTSDIGQGTGLHVTLAPLSHQH